MASSFVVFCRTNAGASENGLCCLRPLRNHPATIKTLYSNETHVHAQRDQLLLVCSQRMQCASPDQTRSWWFADSRISEAYLIYSLACTFLVSQLTSVMFTNIAMFKPHSHQTLISINNMSMRKRPFESHSRGHSPPEKRSRPPELSASMQERVRLPLLSVGIFSR